jgi:fatty acid desaturase
MEQSPYESFGQVRALVEDLFHIRTGVYWINFLLTMIVAWTGFLFCLWSLKHGVSLFIVGLMVSAMAFYRGLVFVHEITHVRDAELFGFTVFWNAVCGMFLFIPDYTYLCHASHHRVNSFSTKTDPEYLPLSYQRPFQILSPFLVFPLLPLILALRFLIIGPLSIVVGGRFREWVLRYVSSLKLNLKFEWTTITASERRLAILEDLLCVAWWALFISVCAYVGILLKALLTWILLVYLIQCINHFRSLIAHRYMNWSGAKVSYEEQLLDSITITDFSPAAALFTPIGLRYHSLHHMFPTMPFHALPAAHRRLVQQLPAEHLYFRTLTPTFYACMKHFMTIIFSNTAYRLLKNR